MTLKTRVYDTLETIHFKQSETYSSGFMETMPTRSKIQTISWIVRHSRDILVLNSHLIAV